MAQLAWLSGMPGQKMNLSSVNATAASVKKRNGPYVLKKKIIVALACATWRTSIIYRN